MRIAGLSLGRIVGVLGLVFLLACDNGSGDNAFPNRTPTQPASPTETNNLVIGLVGTLSGPSAWRGEDAFEGADLAKHQLNSIPDGPRFRIESLDDGGDPALAAQHIRDLAARDDTVGIIYAGPTEALTEAEDALAARGIPALLLYGDLYAVRRLTPHIFQVTPSFLWQARRIADYTSSDRRYVKVGALVEASVDGRSASESLQQSLISTGADPARIVRYEPGETDFESVLERLRSARVEALVVHAPPASFDRVLAALKSMGAVYQTTADARIESARRSVRRARKRSDWWHPQVIAFDPAFSPRLTESPPAGTIVSAPYARGYYYLPVPSFARFRQAFSSWWDDDAFGWQHHAYDAARMIGWAARRAGPDDDIAEVLETLQDKRFAGTDVTFGPDDHTAVDQGAVGLWVVPSPSASVRERDRLPDRLPWVPLGRGFSIDGREIDIDADDWRYLVKNPPPPDGPVPKIRRLKFGVTTSRGDPVH